MLTIAEIAEELPAMLDTLYSYTLKGNIIVIVEETSMLFNRKKGKMRSDERWYMYLNENIMSNVGELCTSGCL